MNNKTHNEATAGFDLNKLKAELYEAGRAEHAALVAVAEAAKRCPQWLGKMIADKSHMDCVAPNDCVGTLQRLEHALAHLTSIQKGQA
jgi:hypothetical protein